MTNERTKRSPVPRHAGGRTMQITVPALAAEDAHRFFALLGFVPQPYDADALPATIPLTFGDRRRECPDSTGRRS